AGGALAAYAVERAAARPFEAHVTARVLAPLGMTSASFRSAPGDALPHAATDGGHARLAPPSHAVYPVVDLRASARELGRFARAILRGGELEGARVLTPESVAAMLKPALPAVSREQALGWQL